MVRAIKSVVKTKSKSTVKSKSKGTVKTKSKSTVKSKSAVKSKSKSTVKTKSKGTVKTKSTPIKEDTHYVKYLKGHKHDILTGALYAAGIMGSGYSSYKLYKYIQEREKLGKEEIEEELEEAIEEAIEEEAKRVEKMRKGQEKEFLDFLDEIRHGGKSKHSDSYVRNLKSFDKNFLIEQMLYYRKIDDSTEREKLIRKFRRKEKELIIKEEFRRKEELLRKEKLIKENRRKDTILRRKLKNIKTKKK